jgi:hypothetical protein
MRGQGTPAIGGKRIDAVFMSFTEVERVAGEEHLTEIRERRSPRPRPRWT